MTPLDVATMLKAKASGSGERLDSGSAFSDLPVMNPLVVWISATGHERPQDELEPLEGP